MATTQSSNTFALIFTNTGGHVIFADRNYLRITGQPANKIVSGRPLVDVLPLDPPAAVDLGALIKQGERSRPVTVPIQTASGAVWLSSTTAIHVLDETENLIGVDLAIADILTDAPAPRSDHAIRSHGDVLRTYVEGVFSDGNRLKSRTFIQSYLASQLEVLQIRLARMDGPAVRRTFEDAIAAAASANAVPILIRDGHVEFEQKDVSLQNYRSFLLSVIPYAVDVLGRRLVHREMLAVDGVMAPGTLSLLSQMDLPSLFPDSQ